MDSPADSPEPNLAATLVAPSKDVATSLSHSPAGKRPSLGEQAIRLCLFVVWFDLTCIAIVITQFLGVPLYFWKKDVFYAYVALRMLLMEGT
jgi:hypothetical protein